jgi:hypothetical protein
MDAIAETSTPKTLQSPAGPQLHPIKALHRHDGYIKFMVKDADDPDRMEQQFSIRADALDAWFPEFTAALVRNSFCSINGGYRLADRSSAPWGRPLHNTDSLRFLCACYCDIDYYSQGLKRLQVLAELERMWESGELPKASMVVDSGRGMWLLWLLHDAEDSKRAHFGAYTDNPNDHLQLYTRINKALYTRLNHMGADTISDGVRSIRVPGSFRNDTETYVNWRIHGNSDRAISYTLSDLAAQMGVKAIRRPPAERAALAATRQPRGRQSKAWLKTNQNRLAALVTIKDQRAGGFNKGCRNKAAFFYAMAMRWNAVGRQDAWLALCEMGENCIPPLSKAECRQALKRGYKTRMPKLEYKTMANALDVTPTEAEIVSQALYGNCQPGDRRFFPAAQRFGPLEPITNDPGKNTRRTKQIIRREHITTANIDAGQVLSFREMQGTLLNAGIEASLGTLHSDYKALGLASAFSQRLTDNRVQVLEAQGRIQSFFPVKRECSVSDAYMEVIPVP